MGCWAWGAPLLWSVRSAVATHGTLGGFTGVGFHHSGLSLGKGSLPHPEEPGQDEGRLAEMEAQRPRVLCKDPDPGMAQALSSKVTG